MKIKVTKIKVEQLPLSTGGQQYYTDIILKGFGVCVGKTKKSYYVEKRIEGKTKRYTIGEHGQISTEQARKAAQTLLGKMTAGENPVEERRKSRINKITLKLAYLDLLESRPLKDRTVRDYHYVMRSYFSDWLNKPLSKISKDMVAKRHKKIGASSSGKAQANLAMRYFGGIFNYAIERFDEAITDNPVKVLSTTKTWYEVKRKQTVIKPHELPALFDALDKLKEYRVTSKAEATRDYILLLLFTGMRRQEGATLKWEDIDFDSKTLTVTDTKNKEPLIIPLSDYLHDLLKARHSDTLSDYVFPGSGKSGHLVEPKKQIVKVRNESGVYFSLHDLRRTFITIAESLDISPYALKKLLNHKVSGDVTAGYIIHDVERLRKPMQQITNKILFLAGLKDKGKVVKIHGAGG